MPKLPLRKNKDAQNIMTKKHGWSNQIDEKKKEAGSNIIDETNRDQEAQTLLTKINKDIRHRSLSAS